MADGSVETECSERAHADFSNSRSEEQRRATPQHQMLVKPLSCCPGASPRNIWMTRRGSPLAIPSPPLSPGQCKGPRRHPEWDRQTCIPEAQTPSQLVKRTSCISVTFLTAVTRYPAKDSQRRKGFSGLTGQRRCHGSRSVRQYVQSGSRGRRMLVQPMFSFYSRLDPGPQDDTTHIRVLLTFAPAPPPLAQSRNPLTDKPRGLFLW